MLQAYAASQASAETMLRSLQCEQFRDALMLALSPQSCSLVLVHSIVCRADCVFNEGKR